MNRLSFRPWLRRLPPRQESGEDGQHDFIHDLKYCRKAIDVHKFSHSHDTVARNLILAEELKAIIRTCQAMEVPCIPIRGLALAEQLYGDFTVRLIGDLDLLVRRETLPQVTEILQGLHYDEIDRRPGFARTYSYTLEFVKDWHGAIMVEPHWTIAYPPFADRMDMEGVWRRALPCRLLGLETWRLCQTDLFLNLSFHLLHKWDQAPRQWFYELDRVINQDSTAIDWDLVLETARATGQAAMLGRVVERTRDLFSSPIPDGVLGQLQHPPSRRPDQWATDRLLPLLIGASGVDGRESLALLFRIQGRRAWWRYVLGMLFPSREFMRRHYGASAQSWLGRHYLARLLYFLRQGGKGLMEILVPRPTPR